MKSIRNGNQIWVATHNSEIIDEAGRDKVIYVARDLETRKAKFISGDEEQEALSLLKDMFGFSGYIGVAKNLVFLEGDNSSQDRKFYSALLPGDNSNFKLVPANSSDNLSRINSAILSIMEANLGWMNFHLIRDRDYLTDEMITKYREHSSGKIFVLEKHELENYLINFDIVSSVLEDIFDITKTQDELKALFYDAAINMSSDVIRDMVAFRLNLILRPQDFSIGKILNKQSYFDIVENSFSPKSSHSTVMKNKFIDTSNDIHESIMAALSQDSINQEVELCENAVKSSLSSEGWLSLFPGKELIEAVAKKLGITNVISLQNSIIKEFSSRREEIPEELSSIFQQINSA